MNQFNINQENLNSLIEVIDYTNPITNDFAVRLASNYPGVKNINQICFIFDYINNNWKYVLDSQKQENFRSASRTINNNLAGDCDDYAILIAALMESIGFSTRISFAYNNELGGHAFAEVLIANRSEGDSQMQNIVNWINQYYQSNNLQVNWYYDDDYYWLNLDWFGVPFKHVGGKYYQWNSRTIYYPTLQSPFFIVEDNNESVNSSDDEESVEIEINLPTIELVHEVFNPIISKHSIFIGDSIPQKKYNNFINQFNLEYFNQSINLVYYDSTLFGKGDNGFFLINNYSNTYFFYSSLEGLTFCVSLYDDNVNGYISEYSFEPNKGILLNLKFPNTDFTYYSLEMNEEVALSLVRFLDISCGNI